MGIEKWGEHANLSAAEYEARYGEKRTARRIVTPAGVAFAVKQTNGEHKVWRMDQLLGTVMKHSRPTCWVACLPGGKHLTTESNLKWCVERMQMATPVSGTIEDIATKQYVEQLIKKYGAVEAKDMTYGPARDVFNRIVDASDHVPEAKP